MPPAETTIGIVGGGISGLSCGIRLLEAGHDVELLAPDRGATTTSDVAAAFWYPYRVGPRERVLAWSARTYEVFRELSRDPATGVVARTIVQRYEGDAPEPWFAGPVADFARLGPDELFPPWTSGWRYTTYLAPSPRYMPWLRARFEALGGRRRDERVARLDDLAGRYALVVHCPGTGAGETVGDAECIPIRGQVIRVRRPAHLSSDIRESVCAYVVPREDDVILGGTADDGDWSTEPRDDHAARIRARCAELCPELFAHGEPEVLEHRVGLRPGRPVVRLERETRPSGLEVVHDYGHGGAGYTLSWGCAEAVRDLVAEAFGRSRGAPAKPVA